MADADWLIVAAIAFGVFIGFIGGAVLCANVMLGAAMNARSPLPWRKDDGTIEWH